MTRRSSVAAALALVLVVDAVGQEGDRRAWNGVRAAAQLAAEGHRQSAQRVLTVALELDPTSSEALLLSAQWQADERAATGGTRELLERAVAAASWVETSPLVAAQLLATIYVRTREPARAVALLRPLLEYPLIQQPQLRAAAATTLARAHLAAGEPREAGRVAQGGLLLAPSDVELHLAAAAAADAIGGPAAATAQLELAALAAPEDRRLRLALAAARARTDDDGTVPVGEAVALAPLLPVAVPPAGQLRPEPLQEARWLGAALQVAASEAVAGDADADALSVVRSLIASGASALADVVARVHAVLAAAEAAAETEAAQPTAASGTEPPKPPEPPQPSGARALAELELWHADFSGVRYVDADGDGHWEEQLQFVGGELASWLRDADQDGVAELTVELDKGVPALVTGQSVVLEYGAYPLLSVARVEAGELDGEWLLRPGALSLLIEVRGAAGAAASTDRATLPVTVAVPAFPAVATIQEASYLRRQWRAGRLWAVTSRLDAARSIRREDRDGDGRFERVVVLRQQRPTRAVTDLDGDGHAEVAEIFDAGRLDRIEYDGNRDGVPDALIDVASGDGIAWDLNGDGTADVRERTLADGIRVREFSTRLDGMFDTRTELR